MGGPEKVESEMEHRIGQMLRYIRNQHSLIYDEVIGYVDSIGADTDKIKGFIEGDGK